MCSRISTDKYLMKEESVKNYRKHDTEYILCKIEFILNNKISKKRE